MLCSLEGFLHWRRIGLFSEYNIYYSDHNSFDISGGIERGLNKPETDITIELGYGFSF